MGAPCRAALMIKGAHYPCDWPTDESGTHTGWVHNNRAAEAIWIGPEEVPNSSIRNPPPRDNRPHSRACGIWVHQHGAACHSNCPTCHGNWKEPYVNG
jgi:hypothetical protein